MTVTLLLLVGLLVAAHVGGYITLVSHKRTRARVLAAVLALEAFMLLHVVVGVYAQKRWDAIGRITQRIRGTPTRPSFPMTVSGDPALLTVSTAATAVQRPDFSSLEALARWQVALRQRLRDSLLAVPGGIDPQAPRWEELGVETVTDGVQRCTDDASQLRWDDAAGVSVHPGAGQPAPLVSWCCPDIPRRMWRAGSRRPRASLTRTSMAPRSSSRERDSSR